MFPSGTNLEASASDVVEDDPNDDEDFMVWKKNTPFLYDFVISHALVWPSLTVQFLPNSPASSPSSVSSIILGTHTSDNNHNHLMLANVQTSSDPTLNPCVQITQMIPHQGEVNRARYMPQKPTVIATKTCGTDVHLFDCGSEEIRKEGSGPDAILKGLGQEGYGLSWSEMKEGILLSGSYDGKICLWDLGGDIIKDGILNAKDVFEAHGKAVEDVSWHSKNENLFSSVGDDYKLMIWDLRILKSKKPIHSIVAHEKEVNSVSFNPFSDWILATASADNTINLFDMRVLNTVMHTFTSHTDEVVQVDWSPNHETILASCADDNRLMIWDLDRIGDEQATEDAEDGPPELLFVHGGHMAKISEFSWDCTRPWVIASVAEDNILQVWKMEESIFSDD